MVVTAVASHSGRRFVPGHGAAHITNSILWDAGQVVKVKI
jgi:hypothetical protein